MGGADLEIVRAKLRETRSQFLAAKCRPRSKAPAFMIAGYGFCNGFGFRQPFLIR